MMNKVMQHTLAIRFVSKQTENDISGRFKKMDRISETVIKVTPTAMYWYADFIYEIR